MNYDWQMPGMLYRQGVVDTDYSSSWSLNYSTFALKPLNEDAFGTFNIGFDQTKMVPVGRFWQTTAGTFVSPNKLNQRYRLVPMAGLVNRLDASAALIKSSGLTGKADLNYADMFNRNAGASLTTLAGADDWSNLIYDFRESPSNAKGQHGTEDDEINSNDIGDGPLGPTAVDPVVVGSDAGKPAELLVYAPNGTVTFDLHPFNGFSGGVRVAKGDVNGDGTADIIAAEGPGGDSITVYDGKTGSPIYTAQPYGQGFTGGMNVAAGDVDGDGHVDIIVAPASGTGSNVEILNGMTGAVNRTILAYLTTTKTGVTVATGDVNGDGKMDIIVGPASGGSPLVKVFNGPDGKLMKSFTVLSPAYNGVYLAAADLDGDGKADIIAGAGGGSATALQPMVRIYSGANPSKILTSYLVDDPTFHGGVRVAVVKTETGGYDVVTATGPGHQPQLARFGGLSVADNWDTPVFDNTFSGAFVG
jgi:hypothetical protein